MQKNKQLGSHTTKKLSKFSTPHPNPLPDGVRGNGKTPSPVSGEGRISKRGTSFRNSGEGYNPHVRNDNNVRSTVTNLVSCKSSTPHPNPLPTGAREHLAAFTLAEVLITLGIIGVVAAVTMPTLIQNHTKSVIESRLKKFYSSINQAIILYEQETGDMRKDWSVTSECDDSSDSYSCNLLFFDKYLKKYMNYTKIENKNNQLYVYLADGSAVRFLYYGKDMHFYPKASVIGKSNIKQGKDIFIFGFYPNNAGGNRAKEFNNKGAEPYIVVNWDGTYEGLYDSGTNGGKIIQLNGWKIPDDYPFLK